MTFLKKKRVLRNITYFSQWESNKLTESILEGKISPKDDPRWKDSGAESPEDYDYWSWNICGTVCIRMVLKDALNIDIPNITLAKELAKFGAYIPRENKIDGLIYEPACKFLTEKYGLKAKTYKYLPIWLIKKEIAKGNYVIASVGNAVRQIDFSHNPTRRGGHLVLVTGFDDFKKTIFVQNSAGIYQKSQINHEVPLEFFKKDFAYRGMVIIQK